MPTRALLIACIIGTILPDLAHAQFPDAPGKDEGVRLGGTCHEPQRAASVRLTREGWQDTIVRMVGLGMKGSDAELALVLDYLSAHFKGDALKPLNLNRASAIELESVAGLLRKEAAAWIAHRTKVGACKSLDGLKKVGGVTFRKIDDHRDRLVCF